MACDTAQDCEGGEKMRIDLRYLIIVAMFYVPGALLLIGAWALGYSTNEAREGVALIGAILGSASAITIGGILFAERGPIWWQIGGKK